MITPHLRYLIDNLRLNAETCKSLTGEAGKNWAPQLHAGVPLAILQLLASITHQASCRGIEDAEVLLSAGFSSVTITRPVVDPIALTRLNSLVNRGHLTLTIDHFRHAELLSQSVPPGDQVSVLIDVDLGRQTTGVRPGPDSTLLAQATAQLPGLRLRGVYLDDAHCEPTSDTGESASLTLEDSLAIARHCQRMIQNDGIELSEIVTGFRTGLSSVAFDQVTTVLATPLVGGPCSSLESSGLRTAVELVCRVVSRPSLEWCVVNVGTRVIHDSRRAKIVDPAGCCVLRMDRDVSTLSLSGESLDLRIGSEVVIVSDTLCDDTFVLRSPDV